MFLYKVLHRDCRRGPAYRFVFITAHERHFFHPYMRATPAAWRIAADYRPDTFIWSVSALILSSLTPGGWQLCLVPARGTRRWVSEGRPGRRASTLRLNLKLFVCCCLRLECVREWAVERHSPGLRGADVGAPPPFWERKHALSHTFTFNCTSLPRPAPGLRAPIVRAHRPRGPNAPHSGSFFHPHTPPPPLSRKHDKHLLFLCRSCVWPRRLGLPPPQTE